MSGQELYEEGKNHLAKALENTQFTIYILRIFGLMF